MTTSPAPDDSNACPAQKLLKELSGKWKPEIFRMAAAGPVRFGELLRQLEGASKQSLATALRELEDSALLEKSILQQKPLHIEYALSQKAQALVPVFLQLEALR